MYLDYFVNVPDEKGKITFRKNGRHRLMAKNFQRWQKKVLYKF